jgi:hypothetical protein
MKNKITIKEFKEILNYILDTNKILTQQGKGKITIEALGSHGIGKTECIIQVAEERGIDIIKINLSQIEEIGDLVGFPVKEYQLCNPSGNSEWISEKLLDYYISLGYHACGEIPQRMSYAVPAWVPKDDRECILLLDDFRRADVRYMQAVMELLSRGEYISWKLPSNCTIVLSSNPDSGDYNVTSLDPAQRTRFISLELEFNIDIWAKWAEEVGIDSRIISFCLFYPEIFNEPQKSGVIPRTMVMFANAISGIKNFSNHESLTLINLISEGCFESEENVVGRFFSMFINNKLDRLINPKDILFGEWKSVSTRLANCIYDGDSYRADIGSVLTIRFLNYIDVYIGQKESNSQVIIDRVIELISSEKVLLTEDLIFKLIKSIVAKYPGRFNKILVNDKVKKSILSE